MFADVVLPSRRYQVFTYKVPGHLGQSVRIGSSVEVPLGHTVVGGVVVGVHASPPHEEWHATSRRQWRDVLSVYSGENHPLSPNLVRLVQRVAGFYLAPLAACVPLIVPPQKTKIATRVFLTDKGRDAMERGLPSEEDLKLLQKLVHRQDGLLLASLRRTAKGIMKVFTHCRKERWIEERRMVPRGSGSVVSGNQSRPNQDAVETAETPFMTGEGSLCSEDLFDPRSTICSAEKVCWGSDGFRWQAFVRTATQVLAQNRQILLLVPEVHLMKGLVRACRQLWKERVVEFHGDLDASVRATLWSRIEGGEVDVIVGTRSGVFLPIPRLGLLWLEWEENAGYQEEHLPYYHAREVARMRAELEQAWLVLSSSVLSLEGYKQFGEEGGIRDRSAVRPPPVVEMIDLADMPFDCILAAPLHSRIAHAVDRHEPVILFLNRKGFSHGVICKDCGHTPMCPVCGVTLKLFQRPSRLLCSICGRQEDTPEVCLSCQGTVFRFPGVGTQRLEDEVKRLFPEAVVARVDRDRLKTQKEAQSILESFGKGHICILIGTEWLMHRWNLPKAGLVGFPQADLGLHLPGFRSAERAFQTLWRAVEMADREGKAAEVCIQTRMPNHHVMQAVRVQDPEVFYRQESVLRELLGYPPAGHLVLLAISGRSDSKVQMVADFFQRRLEKIWGHPETGHKEVVAPMASGVLGPLPSRKGKGRQKTRTLFLIKTKELISAQHQLSALHQECLQRFPGTSVVVEFQVDPLEIQ